MLFINILLAKFGFIEEALQQWQTALLIIETGPLIIALIKKLNSYIPVLRSVEDQNLDAMH